MTEKPSIQTMLAVWREEYEEGEWVHVHDKVDGSWRHRQQKGTLPWPVTVPK